MKLLDYLDRSDVEYEVRQHDPCFTAQQIAEKEHICGMNIAKPVMIRADGIEYLCVLPACCMIDFWALKGLLTAEMVELVSEEEMTKWFYDCEIGAEPPFGSVYGLPTLMDDRLEADEFILFQDGRHDQAVRMRTQEYKRIEKPRVISFSYHL